jgi:branched-chain amino acid aminotransferase
MEWNESNNLSKFIWVNGKFVPWDKGYVHVLTHSLHYAGAVYEGERAYNGKVFKLEEHTNRLLKSAELMHLDVKYSAEEINQATKDVLEKNGLKNAYVRPLIWRGAESLGVCSKGLSINLLILAVDSNPKFVNGLKLQLGPWRKPSENSIPPQAKSSAHYAMMSISQKIAQENGYDDALLLDSQGAVAESSVTNIFFVKNGELITPIADRFLNGITRQTVFEMAKKLGIKAKEQRISLEELKTCESCFICGTSAEIKGVSLIESNGEIIEFASDEITIILQKEYAKLTGKIL